MISKADKPSGARDTRIDETERFRRIVQNPKTTQLEIGFGLAEMISKGKSIFSLEEALVRASRLSVSKRA